MSEATLITKKQNTTMNNMKPKQSEIEILASAVILMAQSLGTRLTTGQMCERYQVCSKTLLARAKAGKLPKPTNDGKWLLSELIEMEARR